MEALNKRARDSWESLYDSSRKDDYSGYDPYDGLNSRLFQATPLFRNNIARLLWIQFFKRCPVNLRSLVGICTEPNPKGLGLFISGLILRYRTTGDRSFLEDARCLSDRLFGMTSPGLANTFWGYNFDWQARWHGKKLIMRGCPNVVVTSFILHAFLDLHEALPSQRLLEAAESAVRFISRELIHSEGDRGSYIGYVPGISACIHNANLLGASLVARVFAYNKDPVLKEVAIQAAAFSVSHQRPDGSWFYSTLDYQRWIDHFHTGYNLMALRAIERYTGDGSFSEAIDRGYRYYLENFFLENGCTKYYYNQTYPVDIHSCAQAVITPLLVDFDRKRAIRHSSKSLSWILNEMERGPGCFVYQRHRWWINPISYIRWGEAWMFYALALFLSCEKDPSFFPISNLSEKYAS